jgi:hypothetical protein
MVSPFGLLSFRNAQLVRVGNYVIDSLVEWQRLMASVRPPAELKYPPHPRTR